MSCLYDRYNECQCSRYLDQRSSTILFNILNRKDCKHQINYNLNYNSGPCNCHCEQQQTVCLKNPEENCQVVLSVLVKTINFMSILPSVHHLPSKNQMTLLQSCWAPLFLLGLTQERLTLEVTDVPAANMLKKLLLGGTEQGLLGVSERAQPSLAEVNKLKYFLPKLWNMNLRPKEYAYLKGAMLFNSDVSGLRAAPSLQKEAYRALREVSLLLHPGDRGRFPLVLLAASALLTISPNLVTELFF